MTSNSIFSKTTVIAGLMATSMMVGRVAAEQEDQLFVAARSGDVETVSALISNGRDVDAGDARGYTVLHYAAAYGDAELARMLVEVGADVDARGANDNTPLILAAQERHADVASILIENGADAQVQNAFGVTALSLAADKREMIDQRRLATQVEADATGRPDVLIAIIALSGILVVALRVARQTVGSSRDEAGQVGAAARLAA